MHLPEAAVSEIQHLLSSWVYGQELEVYHTTFPPMGSEVYQCAALVRTPLRAKYPDDMGLIYIKEFLDGLDDVTWPDIAVFMEGAIERRYYKKTE